MQELSRKVGRRREFSRGTWRVGRFCWVADSSAIGRIHSAKSPEQRARALSLLELSSILLTWRAHMTFDPTHGSPIPGVSNTSWPTINQAAAIGSVVVAWNWLDLALETLLATLTKSDEMLTQALTEDLSPDNRLKALRRLALTWQRVAPLDQAQVALVEEIRAISKEVASLKSERNRVAHGLWMRSDDETMFRWKHHIAPVAEQERTSEHKKTSDLLGLTEQIGQLAGRAAAAELIARDLPAFPVPTSGLKTPNIPGLDSLLGSYRLRR